MENKLNLFEKMLVIVVLVFSIYLVFSTLQPKKEDKIDKINNTIKQSAIEYLNFNSDVLKILYNERYYTFISVQDLLDADILTESNVPGVNLKDKIKLKVNLENGNIESEYPLQMEKKIPFFSISETIKLGESFNCVDNLGSYKMAFLDSKGNYIKSRDSLGAIDISVLSKYNLKCEYDSSIDSFAESLVFDNSTVKYVYKTIKPTKKGIYDVYYNFVDDDGVSYKVIKKLKVE